MKRGVTLLTTSMAILALLVPLTLAQTPSPASGRVLQLTGQDAAVAKDNDSLGGELAGNFTIEAWIYMEKLPRGDGQWTVLAKPGSYEWIVVGPRHKFTALQGWDYAFIFLVHPGRCAFGLNCNTIKRAVGKKDIAEEWHHFAVIIDPTRSAWVLDGKNMGGAPFGCPISDSDSKFYVGGIPKQASFFKGWIDELRISNKKRLFSVPPMKRFDPDQHTMALWHFDESMGVTSFEDSSGHGNTLIGHNGAKVVGGKSVESSGKLSTTWAKIKREY